MRFFSIVIKRPAITLLFLCLAGGLIQCQVPKKGVSTHKDFKIHFLDEYVIPFNMPFDSTTVGGLSGIDYRPETNTYIAISDDRSNMNPARFYTLTINLNKNKIDTVIFLEKVFLKNRDGHVFPPSDAHTATVDPESIRYHKGQIIWSSEGERIVGTGGAKLLNPQIFIAGTDGQYIDTFVLPQQVRVHEKEYGARRNGGFEGLSVSSDGRFLYASIEEPLLQDGPRAGVGDSSAIIRIIKFDMASRQPVAQYAYQIDPVAHPVTPTGAFRVNGISEILCLDANRLLIIERSYSTGRLTCTIKVFIADLSTATDVSKFDALKDADYRIAPKELVLNMDQLGRFVDNIEGVTFGPQLADGRRSLIFIADNNFNFLERSQIFLFAVEE